MEIKEPPKRTKKYKYLMIGGEGYANMAYGCHDRV